MFSSSYVCVFRLELPSPTVVGKTKPGVIMLQSYNPNGHVRPIPLPCPVCGTPLAFSLLEIPEDDGEVVQLFTFDCPTGDFHWPLTKSKITGILAHEVVKRLQR